MKRFAMLTVFLGMIGPVVPQDRVLPPQTLAVRHDHLFGSGEGQLVVSEGGIEFVSEKDGAHARYWSYQDIQELQVLSPGKIRLLTYEDVGWKLQRDRNLKFEVTDQEVSAALVQLLRPRLSGRLVSAVFADPEQAFYSVPVKHRHTLGGGCEGRVIFAEEGVYYQSSRGEESRFWPTGEIRSLGSMSDFSLRLTVREASVLGRERTFQFQLKEPLSRPAFDRLWRRIHEPATWLDLIDLEAEEKLSRAERN